MSLGVRFKFFLTLCAISQALQLAHGLKMQVKNLTSSPKTTSTFESSPPSTTKNLIPASQNYNNVESLPNIPLQNMDALMSNIFKTINVPTLLSKPILPENQLQISSNPYSDLNKVNEKATNIQYYPNPEEVVTHFLSTSSNGNQDATSNCLDNGLSRNQNNITPNLIQDNTILKHMVPQNAYKEALHTPKNVPLRNIDALMSKMFKTTDVPTLLSKPILPENQLQTSSNPYTDLNKVNEKATNIQYYPNPEEVVTHSLSTSSNGSQDATSNCLDNGLSRNQNNITPNLIQDNTILKHMVPQNAYKEALHTPKNIPLRNIDALMSNIFKMTDALTLLSKPILPKNEHQISSNPYTDLNKVNEKAINIQDYPNSEEIVTHSLSTSSNGNQDATSNCLDNGLSRNQNNITPNLIQDNTILKHMVPQNAYKEALHTPNNMPLRNIDALMSNIFKTSDVPALLSKLTLKNNNLEISRNPYSNSNKINRKPTSLSNNSNLQIAGTHSQLASSNINQDAKSNFLESNMIRNQNNIASNHIQDTISKPMVPLNTYEETIYTPQTLNLPTGHNFQHRNKIDVITDQEKNYLLRNPTNVSPNKTQAHTIAKPFIPINANQETISSPQTPNLETNQNKFRTLNDINILNQQINYPGLASLPQSNVHQRLLYNNIDIGVHNPAEFIVDSENINIASQNAFETDGNQGNFQQLPVNVLPKNELNFKSHVLSQNINSDLDNFVDNVNLVSPLGTPLIFPNSLSRRINSPNSITLPKLNDITRNLNEFKSLSNRKHMNSEPIMEKISKQPISKVEFHNNDAPKLSIPTSISPSNRFDIDSIKSSPKDVKMPVNINNDFKSSDVLSDYNQINNLVQRYGNLLPNTYQPINENQLHSTLQNKHQSQCENPIVFPSNLVSSINKPLPDVPLFPLHTVDFNTKQLNPNTVLSGSIIPNYNELPNSAPTEVVTLQNPHTSIRHKLPFSHFNDNVKFNTNPTSVEAITHIEEPLQIQTNVKNVKKQTITTNLGYSDDELNNNLIHTPCSIDTPQFMEDFVENHQLSTAPKYFSAPQFHLPKFSSTKFLSKPTEFTLPLTPEPNFIPNINKELDLNPVLSSRIDLSPGVDVTNINIPSAANNYYNTGQRTVNTDWNLSNIDYTSLRDVNFIPSKLDNIFNNQRHTMVVPNHFIPHQSHTEPPSDGIPIKSESNFIDTTQNIPSRNVKTYDEVTSLGINNFDINTNEHANLKFNPLIYNPVVSLDDRRSGNNVEANSYYPIGAGYISQAYEYTPQSFSNGLQAVNKFINTSPILNHEGIQPLIPEPSNVDITGSKILQGPTIVPYSTSYALTNTNEISITNPVPSVVSDSFPNPAPALTSQNFLPKIGMFKEFRHYPLTNDVNPINIHPINTVSEIPNVFTQQNVQIQPTVSYTQVSPTNPIDNFFPTEKIVNSINKAGNIVAKNVLQSIISETLAQKNKPSVNVPLVNPYSPTSTYPYPPLSLEAPSHVSLSSAPSNKYHLLSSPILFEEFEAPGYMSDLTISNHNIDVSDVLTNMVDEDLHAELTPFIPYMSSLKINVLPIIEDLKMDSLAPSQHYNSYSFPLSPSYLPNTNIPNYVNPQIIEVPAKSKKKCDKDLARLISLVVLKELLNGENCDMDKLEALIALMCLN